MSEKIKSLSEYLERVDTLRSNFVRKPQKELWFRGESVKYKNGEQKTFLRPTLYRPRNGECLRSISCLLDVESELADIFRHSALQLTQERTEDDNWLWDSYFLMQHHAVPSRLLDWSDGALIALHFSVYSDTDLGSMDDSVVYVIDPDSLKDRPNSACLVQEWRDFAKAHPTEGYSESEWECAYLPEGKTERQAMGMPAVPEDPVVLEFPHITRRVAAQRSRFVLFGRNPTWLADNLEVDSFPLKEIIVDGQCKDKIKRQLRDCGITESVVYPDLDGLGREIRELWKIWQ